MQDWYWFFNIVFPLARWAHIVCTTLLVGGVLFYEFVVPAAIADLPEAQQFAVLGNIRWVFRRIVVLSVILLFISGPMLVYQLWDVTYKRELFGAGIPAPGAHPGLGPAESAPWTIAHILTGLLAMAICWVLTTRKKIPRQPLFWLRICLMVMLVSMFLADVARHIRLRMHERENIAGLTITHPMSSAEPAEHPVIPSP